MDVHAFGDINYEFNIRIIVVVRSTRNLQIHVSHLTEGTRSVMLLLPASYLDVLVRHSNVVCICLQIFWSGHHRELNRSFVSEGLVGPFSDRSDLLDGSNTVVRDQDLHTIMSAAAGFTNAVS